MDKKLIVDNYKIMYIKIKNVHIFSQEQDLKTPMKPQQNLQLTEKRGKKY